MHASREAHALGGEGYRGWYWSWIGSLLALTFGGLLAVFGLVVELRNVMGIPNDAQFQLAAVMGIAGIAFILLGFAFRQGCGDCCGDECCDWDEGQPTNTTLRTGAPKS